MEESRSENCMRHSTRIYKCLSTVTLIQFNTIFKASMCCINHLRCFWWECISMRCAHQSSFHCWISEKKFVNMSHLSTEVSVCEDAVFDINSLAPGKFQWNFRYVIFKGTLVIDDWDISCEIALIWISLDFTDDQSTLVQVMAWCRQATSHYLSQCWQQIYVAIWCR